MYNHMRAQLESGESRYIKAINNSACCAHKDQQFCTSVIVSIRLEELEREREGERETERERERERENTEILFNKAIAPFEGV